MWCCIRNKLMFCGLIVRQVGQQFTLGIKDHCHSGKPGQLTLATLVTQVREKAADQLFAPASQIVDQALIDNITDAPIPLVLLARGKRWYLDATFKVVKAPFTQLFSIHCFVKKGNSTKQVPLVFVLMSGKKKRDYIAVLQAVQDLLPGDICLEEVLVHFEHALWKAMEAVFPNVVIKGCCLHWKQAVWRKIQETGLQPAYMEKADVYRLLSNLMGLPFLPAEFIHPMFQSLRRKAGTPMLQRVFDYVAATWITGPVWPPTTWSCYGQSIRTNNDCEGWHLRLLTKARKIKVPMYLLIKVLHDEALFVEVQVKLVSEHKLKKHQRKIYRKTQRLVFRYWGEFADGERSAKSLLHACACLF
ncbi:uncharacterized protein [Asterias amurensis]|uniref:uncharacterized protein n=1 Tax=Asterias amurensis TaxID=7602 RepID=UPI003AB2AF84